MRFRSVPYVVQVSLLTALYFGAAKLGFVAAFAQGNVSSIWPPTGLAFAALLLFGPRLWPGIALGEFLANASAGTPLASALGMGMGNALEALLGVALLHRVGFRRSLDRLQDVLGLAFSAFVSPLSSATIGVASLLLGGVIALPAVGSTWLVWWAGDVMGALVLTPALLIWYTGLPSDLSAARMAEAGIVLVALAAISQIIFGSRLDYSYILFPCIVWAALRFGQHGATAAILLTAGVAVWDTANGSGPFARATLYQSLFFVQTFIGVVALTGLVLAAIMAERVHATEALRRQNAYLTDLHETTFALMNRLDLADLLQTIVTRAARLLGTSHGYLYLVDPEAEESELKVGIGRFREKVGLRLKMGDGLVGKVWQSGQALVINEYDQWSGRTPGLPFGVYHAVIGTPLKIGARIVGVLGFAHTEPGQTFGENDFILLNGFAQLAALAYDNARLYDEAQGELNARTQAIAALRDSEELYRLITENTRDLITLLDQEGRCVYTSPSYSSILGYAPVELIGLPMAHFVHQDDLALVSEQLGWLARPGAMQTTFRARHANGSWRWLETFWIATVQQGIHYNLAVGRDITERRRLEAQFLQAQKMEGIGRLAGGVAHDFNNLLTAILSYTDLAREALAPNHPVRADLDEVARAARRASELTRQLLAFARKQVIEPQVLSLNDLIDGLDRMLRRLIGEDIELIVRPEPNLSQVRADPGQIEQVLVNLAVNARDAMPGGGQLIVETHNVTLEEFTAAQQDDIAPGDYVLIEVSDTGVGMDPETQRRIFEPFFTTKGPGRGTGLGLATCYGIVKQHGGYIVLYSEAGLGSTFKIYLPRTADQITLVAQRPSPASVLGGGETILLAEDDPAVRGLAGRVLRERGYTVIEATNGEEALHIAQARNGAAIDLLLTDVVMPQMGGAALAQQLRALRPDLRVLFISGYTDSALSQHGRMDSGMELLHKPFSPGDLARKVRELLDT